MDNRALQVLYSGSFEYYFNHCQFCCEEDVKVFCISLVENWHKLCPALQSHITTKLKEAWKKEKDYGKDSEILSPFGKNQKAWYGVVEKVLGETL